MSGTSALIYQVVWQRLLTVHYGVGPASVALIVSVFMLGLGIGSIVGGRWAEQGVDVASRYAAIEIIIGALGLASGPVIGIIGRSTAGSGPFVMFLILFVILLPPTLLMGATLPLLTKAYGRAQGSFLGSVAMLYGINTLGAAAGCILASYVLISLWGNAAALYTAAVLNAVVAAVVFAARRPFQALSAAPADQPAPWFGDRLYVVAFLSGFLGIGYEILWFRVVSVVVKDSPYAFSTMLAVYLLALGAGSLLVTALIRRRPAIDKAAWLAWVQLGIAAATVASLAALPLVNRIPIVSEVLDIGFGQQIHPPITMPRIRLEWIVAFDIVLWPMAVIGAGALLFGAGFPLLASLGLKNPNREGDAISRVYALTILGNVCGGLVTGFLLLPVWKTEGTWLAFVATGAIIAAIIGGKVAASTRRVAIMAAAAVIVIAGASILAAGPRVYPILHRVNVADPARVSYFEEGVEGVVLTSVKNGVVTNLINGTSHGGRPGYAFYYETIEALSRARDTRHLLIIGLGAGSVLEQALMLDTVEDVTLVEVNCTLITNLRKIDIYQPLLSDRRLTIVIDDGRRFLQRTDRRFDAVLIDPLRTRSAYSNNLYSEEFYRLASSRLAPGGVMMVWTDEFRIMPQTFAAVFPNVLLFDFFMVGSPDPMTVDAARRDAMLAPHPQAARDAIAHFDGALVGDQSLISAKRWPINTDYRPAAEYFLGHVYRGWTSQPWMMRSWAEQR
ncbi:MAG: fused MFS/spermidine synthase [Cyanobacteria bacterium]|nr:fused MFS/spermidine synthase [Cyanobacteriota bacterium]